MRGVRLATIPRIAIDPARLDKLNAVLLAVKFGALEHQPGLSSDDRCHWLIQQAAGAHAHGVIVAPRTTGTALLDHRQRDRRPPAGSDSRDSPASGAMRDDMRETEVKLRTPDLVAVEASLEAVGATMTKGRVFERNFRYDRADGSLTAAGVVLRLRQDEAVKLTYKADASLERGIVSRFEAEVAVGDFATMDVILRRLGYEVALVYEKYRTTYAMEGAEIVLDELPFGNFTEIEGEAAAIERVMAALGLGGARRMTGSYTDIFLALRERLGIKARDCSFAAFAGVELGDGFSNYRERRGRRDFLALAQASGRMQGRNL